MKLKSKEHTKVTVMIPVGPYEIYKKWLKECIQSVRNQTHEVDEILLIDDMAGLKLDKSAVSFNDGSYLIDDLQSEFGGCRIWRAPWRLGGVAPFNCGVALARNDLVFMLSCDDTLRPECIEHCVKEWHTHHQKDGYYYVGCHYMGNEWPDQTVPFSGAMVTKGLWKMMGGFPPETASGGGDAAVVSIMMVHFADRLIPVAKGRPLYNYRVHKDTVTAQSTPWMGVIEQTRGLVTKLWQPPKWGRME